MVRVVILDLFMKKIVFFVFAVLCAASCMNGTYQQDYPLVADFTYPDDVYTREFGADSTCLGSGGGFPWNDIAFHNKVTATGEFQGGFILSYLEAPGLGEKGKDYIINPYRVAGKPFERSNTYTVYYENPDASKMPEHSITFLVDSKYGTCVLSHCYVNNTEQVYEAAKSFEPGDKLVLTATGYLGGSVTGTAEINLALPDTTMYSWTKFDLTKLGSIDAIDFDLYASRSGIPTSFCLDELNAKVSIEY